MNNSVALTKENYGFLFILFGIWSFILICRPQDYLLFLSHVRPNLTLGLLTLLIYMLSKSYKSTIAPSDQLKRYFFLVAVIVFSVPFSLYRRDSLMELISYSSVVVFFYLFYRIVNTTSKLRSLIFIYCLGISVYALYILKSGSYIQNRIFFGGMFDPNDIAYLIISFIVFNIIYLTKNNRKYVRIISIINITISLMVILKTGSRGGLLSLIVVIAYLLFSKNKNFKVSFIKKIILLFTSIICLLSFALNTERYKTIMDLSSDYNVTDEEGRLSIWKIGMRLMVRHPFVGVGFNQFPHGVGKDREERGLLSARWMTAHNSLIQIGAETGIFGLILFSLLSYNAFRIFGEVATKSLNIGLLQIGELAKAGFIGNFISAMFLSQAYSVYWAFYIVLSAVLKSMMENEWKPSSLVS